MQHLGRCIGLLLLILLIGSLQYHALSAVLASKHVTAVA